MSLCFMAFKGVIEAKEDTSEKEISEMPSYEPIVVLELFTSQGCSSCPAADVLLEASKKEFSKEVYALSYHVDYWNYIGWKDPFSKANYSKKQRKYNVKFRNNSNYTPQVVINGKEHVVGSSKPKMSAAIQKYKKMNTDNHIVLGDVKVNANTISFSYEVEGSHKDKNIRAIVVLDERTTSVKRGENRNRTLKNSNIVVAQKIEALSSEVRNVTIAIPEIVKSKEKISLIVLVEDDTYTITAAAKKGIERI